MNKFKLNMLMLCLLSFSGVNAAITYSDVDLFNKVEERDTILFRAKAKPKKENNVNKSDQIDINKLASDAINATFIAYAPTYDRSIAMGKERLIAMGAGNSSAQAHVISENIESFASAIINQIEAVANRLSPNEKQIFWNISEQQIIKILNTYCQNHGAGSKVNVTQHISNLIQMKKTFG